MKVYRKVTPYEKLKPGTGEISYYIKVDDNIYKLSFTKDQIRDDYYDVLGIKHGSESLDSKFERYHFCPSVDVPEDIVVCEIALEREKAKNKKNVA